MFKKIIQGISNFLDRRQEIKLAKIDAKTQRKEAKWDAFSIAYANGIDPRASVAGAIGDAFSNVSANAASALSNIYGFGFKPRNRPQEAYSPLDIPGGKQNILIIVLLFIFMLFIPKGAKNV